jgi:hypothetical protein
MNPKSDIILLFVSRYDVPFKYDEAIGKLWEMGCFDEPQRGENIVRVANFVGACYCAMIREDVYLHLAEGLQLIRRSRRAWDELEKLEKLLRANTPDKIHYRYILARWEDARGRLLYRTGNYTLARIAFIKALAIAGDPRTSDSTSALYWCWPDIKSNLERTNFEIACQSGSPTDIANKANEVRKELEESIQWTEWSVRCESDDVRRKELLRGLVSCLHNWLSCNAPADDQYKKLSDRLKELLSGSCQDDVYRKAQALTTEGQQAKNILRSEKAKKEDKEKAETEAKEKYQQLSTLPWPRGRFFAKQNLADLSGDWDTLLKLCEEVEADVANSGGVDAIDIDRYHWTLNFAEKLVPQEALVRERLQKQQQAVTRVLSGVVSVAAYRQRFEKMLRPRLRQ